jgi:hypothetical protein
MFQIVIALVLFFTVGEIVGEKAKKKGYKSLGFRFLVVVSFFGFLVLSTYLLRLIVSDFSNVILSMFIGFVASYFVPFLIIKNLQQKNIIDDVKLKNFDIDNQDKEEINN